MTDFSFFFFERKTNQKAETTQTRPRVRKKPNQNLKQSLTEHYEGLKPQNKASKMIAGGLETQLGTK